METNPKRFTYAEPKRFQVQTSTIAASIASELPAGDLLTAGALNNAAFKVRGEFRKIGIDFPVPFIAWQHGLDQAQTERLQNLMASNGAKRDRDLLDLSIATLRSMSKGVLRQKAA